MGSKNLNSSGATPNSSDENNISWQDEEVAEKHLRFYESDADIRLQVAKTTARQMRDKRERGEPVNNSYIKIRARGNLSNYKAKPENEKHGLEALDEMEMNRKGTAEGKYYKGIDAPPVKPSGPSGKPDVLQETGAILRECIKKCLNWYELQILHGKAEGKTNEEIAEELNKEPHAIETALTRIKKKIQNCYQKPPDDANLGEKPHRSDKKEFPRTRITQKIRNCGHKPPDER